MLLHKNLPKIEKYDRDTNKGILERGRMGLQDRYIFRRYKLTVAPAHIIKERHFFICNFDLGLLKKIKSISVS